VGHVCVVNHVLLHISDMAQVAAIRRGEEAEVSQINRGHDAQV
jgi:hypothetical protein